MLSAGAEDKVLSRINPQMKVQTIFSNLLSCHLHTL